MQIRLELYRISAPANPKSGHFFGNPAKSGSGQISSRICRMPVHLQYVHLITDKTNAADLLTGVFAILIGVARTNNFIAVNFVKNWQTVA